MAKKSTGRKKSGAAARTGTRPAARRGANPDATPADAGCYVSVPKVKVAIAREKPKTAEPGQRCDGFDQAKRAVIDALVDAIDDAERKLAACKRASGIEELRRI